jgi:hypothetical protein
MSSSREIVTDIPKESRHMLGDDEEVYYKGKTKRYAPGGEPVQPTEIFVTNQKIILYNHKFFGRGTIEDLHSGDILNSKMKKGIFSCHIELKSKFLENDTIVIQAVTKAYYIASITNGIREVVYVVRGRIPQ